MTIKKIEDKIELWFVKNDVKEKKKTQNTTKKFLLVLEDKICCSTGFTTFLI